MPGEDTITTRMVQREIGRRSIDSSRLDVKVIHGVVYLRGVIRRIRGHDVDLNKELEVIHRVLRAKPEIREVIIDVNVIG
jgi:hypothetical protein